MSKPVEIEKAKPKYRVISIGNRSDLTKKTRELSFILNNWNLFTENREDRILDKKISTAMIGSAYTQSSPALTLRQLFNVWRQDRAIHTSFYDEEGAIIEGPLYMVGMGGSVLSGAFVFWGIVPSRGLIVNSNRSPEPYKCSVPSNVRLYENAAKES